MEETEKSQRDFKKSVKVSGNISTIKCIESKANGMFRSVLNAPQSTSHTFVRSERSERA